MKGFLVEFEVVEAVGTVAEIDGGDVLEIVFLVEGDSGCVFL